jgi:LPXTG-site transpeptidase (sortase) family protein
MSQTPGSSNGGNGPRDLLSRRGALPLLGAGAVVAVVIVAIAVLAFSGGGSSSPSQQPATGESGGLAAGSPLPTPEATIDLNRPTAVPTVDTNAPKPGAPGDKIVISKIGVDAPLTLKSVGLDGQMPNPDGEDDLAVYDFSQYWPGLGGIPGYGGNTVFAGHVDSGFKPCKHGTVQPPCQSVLWDLGKLNVGDQIQVNAAGKTYTYAVTSNQPVSATSGDWTTIVSSTAQETLTIITCGGDFNTTTHEYSHRQVVTAARGPNT